MTHDGERLDFAAWPDKWVKTRTGVGIGERADALY